MGFKLNILKDLGIGFAKLGVKKTLNVFKGGEKDMPENDNNISGSPSGTINGNDVKASGKVLLWAGVSALIGAASQNIEVIKNIVTSVFPEPYNLLVSTVVINAVMYLGKRWAWNNSGE